MKEKVKIIIVFSELSLKGNKKNYFIDILEKNIFNKLNKYNIKFEWIKNYDNFELTVDEEKYSEVKNILKKISGISWFAKFWSTKYSKEDIEYLIKKILNENLNDSSFTYRITAKDNIKTIFKSTDELIYFTANIINNNFPNSKVSLKKYDVKINVTIKNNIAFFYLNKEKGLIGLPAGSNGNMLVLLSGGIDSPVAAIKTISRGYNVAFITFLTYRTGTTETINKIKKIASKINEFNGEEQKLFLVNFSEIQNEIRKQEYKNYRLIILKRQFIKFANLIANKYQFKAIITGESLGQVGSQTIDSLSIISKDSDLLIVRPLISMSKIEIISNAKEFETYNLSIQKGDDTCQLFQPENPVVYPTLKKTLLVESQLKDIENKIENVENNFVRIF